VCFRWFNFTWLAGFVNSTQGEPQKERDMTDDGPDYRQQQELEEQEQQDDQWQRHAKSLQQLKELREEMKCTRLKSNSNAHSL